MLTGEYLVLKGATSLALATKYGQSLEVEPCDEKVVRWQSYNQNDELWFEAYFDQLSLDIESTSDKARAAFIQKLLRLIRSENPSLFNGGLSFVARLDFDPDWGLGSSSTLLNNLSRWSGVDAFYLMQETIGGSGYDIAVANAGGHILYSLEPKRDFKITQFDPPFKDEIHFVYLNQKQSSESEVKKFNQSELDEKWVGVINEITNKISQTTSLEDFEGLITEHNQIMSEVLQRPSSQEVFSDYTLGVTKYLGAWGGDFMLVTGTADQVAFFKEKGFGTVLGFEDMIS